ncbi:sulfur carrier protein [Granulicella rosea]|uniref:Sulfur carrier protein n=1 Tax=Granulicella rosea TaxID=474952 RepID=A0A239JAE7_9BACT|nr:sulfur carrier protein ThiS [Granulicella rosea]SNT02785.1 sulfur carrier protein [Granulicella rosea]
MSLTVILNGQSRSFETLDTPTTLDQVVGVLGLKADRVAVERNGEITPRSTWSASPVADGDKLEIVHFVGGGSGRV